MTVASCPLEGKTGHDAAWQLLAALYRAETGDALPPVVRTERGKPYFTEGPYHFSLSHTKHYAFCVLAKENVAIDAEELTRQVNPALAEKILSPGEKAQYAAAKDQNKALLTFWVLKEAAAKLSGEGLRGYPNHTNFSLNHPGVIEENGCIVALLTQENVYAI